MLVGGVSGEQVSDVGAATLDGGGEVGEVQARMRLVDDAVLSGGQEPRRGRTAPNVPPS